MATRTPITATIPTFEESLKDFPYNPTTEEGKGFLPILGRSIGHLLYLVGRYDDTAKSKPTQARAKEEVDDTIRHWKELVINNSFSTKAQNEVKIIGNALTIISTEIESWTPETSLTNLQILTNRMLQLMANMDREVLGIRESDAGFNL